LFFHRPQDFRGEVEGSESGFSRHGWGLSNNLRLAANTPKASIPDCIRRSVDGFGVMDEGQAKLRLPRGLKEDFSPSWRFWPP
jgi:hypothetical protein